MILTLSHFPASYQYGEEYEHEHGKEHHDGADHALTAHWNWLLENQCVKCPGKGQPGSEDVLDGVNKDRCIAQWGTVGGERLVDYSMDFLQNSVHQLLFMLMYFLRIIEHRCLLHITI